MVDVDVQRDGKDLRVTGTLYAQTTPDRNTIRSTQSELTRSVAKPGYLTVLNGTLILADENIRNSEKSACVRVHLRPIRTV